MLEAEKVKIAVLVSGGGTNLQALIDASQHGEIPSGEISLVISNKKNAYALTRANNHNIKALYIEKTHEMTTRDFEKEIERHLDENAIGLIVLAGFMAILSEEFTRKYTGRIINVHPSLIPSFCGKGYYGINVHKAALDYGVKVTGATVHYVNEIPDGGQIIFQKAVKVLPEDNPERLQKRVMEEAEWVLLPMATELVCSKLKS